MRNPLEAHPTWRQLMIVSVALPLVITLAILAFAWPAARIQPRQLPVGVVGDTSAVEAFVGAVSTARPGGFDLRLYADPRAATAAIRHRDVYGAFVITPDGLDVLEASAAGPAVAQLLSTVADTAPGGQPVRVTDVVPISSKDPKGLVLSSALLPLTICGIIVASAIGLVVQFRPASRQVIALASVAAVAALGSYLITQGWLGALPHHAIADWGALLLTILAISSATAGLIALIGAPGLGVAAALFVFVGNPSSGVTSAPELLPAGVDHLGQWLPPGAGANLLRSTAYFDGNGAAGHVGVLLVWVVAGFAAIFLGHHSPIRFAAARRRELDNRTVDDVAEHAVEVGDGAVRV